MTLYDLESILRGDILRNQERFDECAEKGKWEDAAVYAGKEQEARRILTLIRGVRA